MEMGEEKSLLTCLVHLSSPMFLFSIEHSADAAKCSTWSVWKIERQRGEWENADTPRDG